jgi:hypothetical protein
MNTENGAQNRGKLEKLTPEQQSWIVEFSKRARLSDMVDALKKHGIDTSESALSRFIRKRRGEELIENGQELAATAEAIAEQGRGGKLREGTLEVMRQQLFEQAAAGQGPEEARELYGALVKEEAQLKELELEARKVAALEQQVKLQEKRIEVEAMKARAALGRVRAEVTDTKAEASDEMLTSRPQIAPAGETTTEEDRCGQAKGLGAQAEGVKRWMELCGQVMGILNRGGDPGERILEARGLLAEEFSKG